MITEYRFVLCIFQLVYEFSFSSFIQLGLVHELGIILLGDAHHITQPPNDGRGAFLAMTRALGQACYFFFFFLLLLISCSNMNLRIIFWSFFLISER